MSSLVRLHQEHPFLLCQGIHLLGFTTVEHHWGFAQHMFASRYALLDVIVVCKMGGGNINSIDGTIEILQIVINGDCLILFRKRTAGIAVDVVCRHNCNP